ncbi:TraB/GumN family protein [Glaciecola petra]|uniref:TraB/GumN family protein n=1 Tax=Glaciecola petra TaxID=3075602 RepID=A0ABU2ZL79_9ALTE|nr:TraB/GumN family protein [Aestuariibacter sp. P117]MDT0593368.1 TraB/GumN family protein [Aestuariibacter sp. P117]
MRFKLFNPDTRRILTLLGTLVFGCSLASAAFAAPVYKVSKGDDTIYIGGTFHLLTPDDYPLPKAFDTAFAASDEVYFETDMAAMEKPEFMQQSMQVMMFQDGSTLEDALDAKTYERLQAHFASRGIPGDMMMQMNPLGVMLTITIAEYQMRGFTAEGVDKHFLTKATEANKSLGWFETPSEQLGFLSVLNSDEPNKLINYTLDELGKIDKMISDLHSSWRNGDMEKLVEVGLEGFRDYPEVSKVLLTQRNNAWMKKIKTMFGDGDTEYILVGALHLPGEDGLLTQLAGLGYKVEQVKP